MRGLVFTEFLDFVEMTAGAAMVEHMIDAADLPSGGAYTRVGNYDHAELIAMIGFLHTATGHGVAEMVHGFGRHLFGRFLEAYPQYFADISSMIDFLQHVEHHVHVEVLKLYPDAELPSLSAERLGDTHLVLHYASNRPFADLCHGLIEAAAEHFGGRWSISRTDVAGAGGKAARFEIRAA